MSTTYTMRIPDCGSLNRLPLTVSAFLDPLVFALSPSCVCDIPTTDGIFDGATALSFPTCNNQSATKREKGSNQQISK